MAGVRYEVWACNERFTSRVIIYSTAGLMPLVSAYYFSLG